jgi:hypothetical protein
MRARTGVISARDDPETDLRIASPLTSQAHFNALLILSACLLEALQDLSKINPPFRTEQMPGEPNQACR